jgi:hypothetical protein
VLQLDEADFVHYDNLNVTKVGLQAPECCGSRVGLAANVDFEQFAGTESGQFGARNVESGLPSIRSSSKQVELVMLEGVPDERLDDAALASAGGAKQQEAIERGL